MWLRRGQGDRATLRRALDLLAEGRRSPDGRRVTDEIMEAISSLLPEEMRGACAPSSLPKEER